jgi:hypothetical protein
MYRSMFLGAALVLAALPVAAANGEPSPSGAGSSWSQQPVPPRGFAAYAVVSGGGIIERSVNVVSAQRLGRGQYEVDFPKTVGTCFYSATISGGKSADKMAPGLIVVQHRFGVPQAVFVSTFVPTTQAPDDYPFHLSVTCAEQS